MIERSAEERARLSAGRSSAAIYEAVAVLLAERGIRGERLLDVGCGTGGLRAGVMSRCSQYIGADAIRHDELPADVPFVRTNLDVGGVPLPNAECDIVACIETIEHVENPRALMRELVRLTRPGGWIVVTTPNQLSLLSKVGLFLKNEFIHFQERPGLYPAHISALLEIDLVRMCMENDLEMIEVRYSGRGRIPATRRDWPHPLRSRIGARGRAFSDNVIVAGRKRQT